MKNMLPILFVILSSNCFAASLISAKTNISGHVVASVCTITISDGSARSLSEGVIDFGVYNKSTRTGMPEKSIVINLFEPGAEQPGCSAFKAGSSGLVKFKFGDEGADQLDSRGVVTRGAGDGVRIAISSVDSGHVSSVAKITADNNVLSYPSSFATQGVFNFKARVEGLDSATSGTYSGSLSLVVSYE
ncbi:type 1 fimbrial protein [Vibrio mediterranei]|jgi:type 1 fimbria pilin|uniref:fimbrial protein n=1 Tax=Vibrio TaxID=662 RepID=UPI0007BBD8E2|nr:MULTISPECIES: type 1 fimbrial protein [Vibrio]OIN26561.1 hypothetical protein AWH66_2024065 [Vibrio barjaei]PTC03332.1 type 1 fimbrial protein [Vibrio mediterranei]